MTLNFLLSQQNKISVLLKECESIENIKLICEEKFSHSAQLRSCLFKNKLTESFLVINHFIPDKDYHFLFQTTQEEKFIQNLSDSFLAILTSTLSNSWQDIISRLSDHQFAIRTGFYQDEFEIYNTLLMGFHGMTIYIDGLDIFQIQYLTEIARDYFVTLFFVVHDKYELNLVLETDAPNIVFSTYNKKNFSFNQSILYNLSQFVPTTANLFALGPKYILNDKSNLIELGFNGAICF
jgi:hypothetical protein